MKLIRMIIKLSLKMQNNNKIKINQKMVKKKNKRKLSIKHLRIMKRRIRVQSLDNQKMSLNKNMLRQKLMICFNNKMKMSLSRVLKKSQILLTHSEKLINLNNQNSLLRILMKRPQRIFQISGCAKFQKNNSLEQERLEKFTWLK